MTGMSVFTCCNKMAHRIRMFAMTLVLKHCEKKWTKKRQVISVTVLVGLMYRLTAMKCPIQIVHENDEEEQDMGSETGGDTSRGTT